MRIGIIGAGMAGLSCAQALRQRGHEPVVFDKGRGPGGRMSTRRVTVSSDINLSSEISFDHGAQYLTVRDPDFAAQVEQWSRAGHVARWPIAGADAWVGTPAMNAPVRAMASGDVRWDSRVDTLSFDGLWHVHGAVVEAGPFDAAIIAVPAEQVAPLVAAHDLTMADAARSTHSDPCWTVMAAFTERVPIDHERLTDVGIIGSAVRNSAKPGRAGPEAWVLQASAEWSRNHLEDGAGLVEQAILAAFANVIGGPLPAAITIGCHRWRYAKSGTLGRDALWNAELRLGVCGDWLLGSRIEAAWLSGQRLAALIG